MKQKKNIEKDMQSNSGGEKIKVGTPLPEILKMRSRQGGYVAWPENSFPNQDQFQRLPHPFFLR